MSSYPGSAQSAYASASAAAQAAVQANHHHHHGGVIGNGRPTVPSSVGVQQQQQQQQQQDCLDYEAKFQVLWATKQTNKNSIEQKKKTLFLCNIKNIVGYCCASSPFSLLFFFSRLFSFTGWPSKLFFSEFQLFLMWWLDEQIFTYTHTHTKEKRSNSVFPCHPHQPWILVTFPHFFLL